MLRKQKQLSWAAKEVLLKAVAAALPIYVMSCFLLPVTLCRKLDKHMARFWWGYSTEKDKAHWVSWRNLCRSKFDGGLRFRRFENFNQALLAKVAWRIGQEPGTLLARVMKGKYFANLAILQASQGSRPSWGWTSILHGRDLLKQGVIWQIGDGATVQVLGDNWVPGWRPEEIVCRASAPNLNAVAVQALMIPGTGRWCLECLQQCFYEDVVARICSIPLPVQPVRDKLVWSRENDGVYSVRSGYHLAFTLSRRLPGWKDEVSFFDSGFSKKVWDFPIQPKLKFFVWPMLRRILPTMEAIVEKEGKVPAVIVESAEEGELVKLQRPVCWAPMETLEHMFLSCIVARALWERSGIVGGVSFSHASNFALFFRWFVEQDSSIERIVRFVAMLWRIWKSRNWVVFDHVQYAIPRLVQQYESQVKEWLSIVQPVQVQRDLSRLGGEMGGGSRCSQGLGVVAYSCFVDGAVAPGSHGAGGLVVRDAMGSVCFVQGFSYAGLVDPFLVELVAFRDAIRWCFLKGLTEVKFYGDAKVVIEKIQRADTRDLRGGRILEEIGGIRWRFQSFEIDFVGRSNNRVAHEVARKTLSLLPASVESFDFERWFSL
ncbi:unnamed protein product [Linum trigynum]|uniref:RNase H type-1 domain-containing protein n=1 Tax=Linum trigynum TaxID=586398 RepID=A0AAV2FQY4_9ROSI